MWPYGYSPNNAENNQELQDLAYEAILALGVIHPYSTNLPLCQKRVVLKLENISL